MCVIPDLSQHLRPVQEPINIFRDLMSVMMLIVVKQNGINQDVFSNKCVTLSGSTEHFTTNDSFKVMAYGKYSVSVTTQFGNFGIHAVTTRMLV